MESTTHSSGSRPCYPPDWRCTLSLYALVALSLGTGGFFGCACAMTVHYLIQSRSFREGLIDVIRSFGPPPEAPSYPIVIQQLPPRLPNYAPARVAAPLPASHRLAMPKPSIRREPTVLPPEHPPAAPSFITRSSHPPPTPKSRIDVSEVDWELLEDISVGSMDPSEFEEDIAELPTWLQD